MPRPHRAAPCALGRTRWNTLVCMPSDRHLVGSGSPFEARIGFSRGVRDGRHVAVSGTAPIWPDGHVDPDPVAQARRCWQIALGALEALGGSAGDVIRTRQYLVDAAYADAASQVHGEVFGEVRPASTMVVVAGLLDERWLMEVELDALLGADEVRAHQAGDVTQRADE